MDSLYSDVIGKILFDSPGQSHLVVIPGLGQESEAAHGRSFPRYDLARLTCERNLVCTLPDGEAFVESLDLKLTDAQPDRVLVFPPLMRRRDLPRELQERYPRMNLEEIVLQVLSENLGSGSLIGAFLPVSFFTSESSRGFREGFFSKNTAKAVVFHEFDLKEIGLQVHASFRAATLVAQIGGGDRLIRLFRMASGLGEHRGLILSDLDRLLHQQGGRTEYGYILRDGLPAGSPVTYELYAPDYVARQKSVGQIGSTKRLSELAEIIAGIDRTLNAHKITDAATRHGVPLVEGRHISSSGQLSLEEIRSRVQAPSDKLLRPDDLCLRRIRSSFNSLFVARVRESDLPAPFSESVILIRPKATTSVEERDVMFAYLRSPHAAEYIRTLGHSHTLVAFVLADMPIPVPDKALSIALNSVNKSIDQFNSWADEATRARNTLFEFSSVGEARSQILSTGRVLWRRIEAANLVSDFRHRVRTLFPHPIAFRWRTVESSYPDLEGYINVLECAEVAICYIAVLAILHSRLVEGSDIKAVHEIAKRLGTTDHGISMGDWVNLVREVRDSKQLAPYRNQPRSSRRRTPCGSMERPMRFLAGWPNDGMINHMVEARKET